MHLADIVIHIDEELGAVEQVSIEEKLREIDGVIAPRFNNERSHLLLVSYDPQHINSTSLLKNVIDSGYSAQLVGL